MVETFHILNFRYLYMFLMLFSLVVDDSQRKGIQIIECNLNKKSDYKILNQLSYFGQLLDICERLHLSLEGAEESHVVRLLQ